MGIIIRLSEPKLLGFSMINQILFWTQFTHNIINMTSGISLPFIKSHKYLYKFPRKKFMEASQEVMVHNNLTLKHDHYKKQKFHLADIFKIPDADVNMKLCKQLDILGIFTVIEGFESLLLDPSVFTHESYFQVAESRITSPLSMMLFSEMKVNWITFLEFMFKKKIWVLTFGIFSLFMLLRIDWRSFLAELLKEWILGRIYINLTVLSVYNLNNQNPLLLKII